MSKLLKLTGIKTYVSAATNAVTVKKGEVCRFTDAQAAHCEKGQRLDKEGEPLKYWTDPSISDKEVHHDFTSGAGVSGDTASSAKVAESPAPAPARKTVTRQRASARATA